MPEMIKSSRKSNFNEDEISSTLGDSGNDEIAHLCLMGLKMKKRHEKTYFDSDFNPSYSEL